MKTLLIIIGTIIIIGVVIVTGITVGIQKTLVDGCSVAACQQSRYESDGTFIDTTTYKTRNLTHAIIVQVAEQQSENNHLVILGSGSPDTNTPITICNGAAFNGVMYFDAIP